MRKYRCLAAAAAWLTVAVSATGEPRTFVFQQGLDGYAGFRDTTIFSEGANSSGGTAIFSAGMNKEGGLRRALLRTDLSSIPAGSIVTSVTLELGVERAPDATVPNTFELHRLKSDWGEGATVATSGGGGSGAPAAEGDATWTSNFHGTSLWKTPDGDFDSIASASTQAGDSGTTTTWSSADMIADVQKWINDPTSNFGWIIIGPETTNRRLRRFASSESDSQTMKLTIVVGMPAASVKP